MDTLDLFSSFDPSEIRMDSKVQSIYTLMSRVRHNEITTPSYQRRKVWGNDNKSRLIESLLVRIPIPVFYIDATNENNWKIIDGLQRITALKEFLVDKTLKLTGLEYIRGFEGLSYDSIPRAYIRRIEETEVTVVFINQGTPDNVKFNIFKRINTGGQPLTPQEIRHALNDGKPTVLLNELADWKVISDFWGTDNDRMEINALVLRALGYLLLDFNIIFDMKIEDYLDTAMKKINDLDDTKISKVRAKFKNSINDLIKIFGDMVFRKKNLLDQRKKPINKNIFETWMAVILNISKTQRQMLVENRLEVIELFDKLQDDSRFNFAISSRKPDSMRTRHNMLMSKIQGIIND
ncbi:TPA: DUF262 domain-containing protein [Yersinia enterocolitica]|uniref:DUF262 domain-containing protein n=1 Tax=Hafnia alvei TaxID=569 RepID=UPI0028BD8E30|nr:DUF262 domain-containing protein [Hafnia alvei]HDL8413135.1 DUF262 domain-containing protein [Yersinia enterocolitica]WNN51983.1 DUF262 domain-containing protein [Hafnia alvei]HED0391804.1 DUF262 domain-containing protein [Yersinia enterocolitica]HEI6802835.1 DUF262 domain-containing protein [Yersinia enterocolitica]HEI6967975.1 DUF262 domain-containing protein [Yersinia enterocolitica]